MIFLIEEHVVNRIIEEWLELIGASWVLVYEICNIINDTFVDD